MKKRPLILKITASVLTLVFLNSVVTFLQIDGAPITLYAGYWLILAGGILSAWEPRGLGHLGVTLSTFLVPLVEIARLQTGEVGFSTLLATATIGFGILTISDARLQSLFHKPSMRWWETSQRYFLKATARISWSDQSDEVSVENISTTGCLVRAHAAVPEKSAVQIAFNEKLILNAVVVRTENTDLGFQFNFKNRHEQKILREYIRETVAAQAT